MAQQVASQLQQRVHRWLASLFGSPDRVMVNNPHFYHSRTRPMDTIPIELEELTDLPSRLTRIRAVADTLQDLPSRWLSPQGSEITGTEWFVLGAVKRTASLVDGFASLLQRNNTLSATALLRLQIDTELVVAVVQVEVGTDEGDELVLV